MSASVFLLAYIVTSLTYTLAGPNLKLAVYKQPGNEASRMYEVVDAIRARSSTHVVTAGAEAKGKLHY